MNKLSHYSLIGNCRSAALVNHHGSIDWCCLPEFHSPAIFAALLDEKRGGYFAITPAGEYQSSQQYITDTNVLETHFITVQGAVTLTDAFMAATEEEKSHTLFPDHEIMRMVQAVSGMVEMKMECEPRLFYGRSPAGLQPFGPNGVRFSYRENIFFLQNTGECRMECKDGRATMSFTAREGETIFFSLSQSSQAPAVIPELHQTGKARMEQTIGYWKTWIGQCTYRGRYQNWVRRSALALKLLSHAPSGSIIAAPTTSLPEVLGGHRNWDYRYCWLRDASFTVRVLVKLGFHLEAHAYMNWILHATQLTRPRLQVVYSVYGDARLEEAEPNWLSGYKGSLPVRTGNGAWNQHQLDVYGEVLDAFYAYARISRKFDRATKKFLLGLGKVICATWQEEDKGIWEVRSGKLHHTHSKVMAWVGLDRLERIAAAFEWKDAPLAQYSEVKRRIRQQVEAQGFNESVGAYTRSFNSEELDASALVFSLVGYCEAMEPRMVATAKAVSKQLVQNQLVYRYSTVDGLEGKEGCFGICNFWMAEYQAKSGNLPAALSYFETVLEHASPTGLLSEEIDPHQHELLGNYPQGFTHIGLINAALSISEALEKKGGERW